MFESFLAENGIYEAVQTSHGHTILEWDSCSQEWISVKLCAMLLDSLDERELSVIEATAEGLKKSREIESGK